MNAPGILDSLIPLYDARERHEVIVDASTDTVYAALERADFSRLFALRLLMGLRTLPFLMRHRDATRQSPFTSRGGVRALSHAGFAIIEENPGVEIALGLQGNFWTPRPRTRPLTREQLQEPPPPDTAFAVWSFSVENTGRGTTRLSTETRVVTGDRSARRRFLRYWRIIRPFSGLIRLRMLQAVRREAQRRATPGEEK